MNQHTISNTTPQPPRPWLLQHYAATRQRTIDLVKATIDRLIQEKQTVTIEAICKRSQQLDPQGKGIKKAGILGNTDAYAYYQQHRTHRSSTPGRMSRRTVRAYRLPTDPGRDLLAVRRRYLRECKPDLVERLLLVEQAYLESQQQLAHVQFELFEQQQKAQKKRENRSF
ncbi:MAG TPA: hypothetical protein VEL31_02670 [Ktedonobacteraceae bacterium]|nr:hypothetical protein [Ktedonobacteraceae bacterium]